MVTACGYRRSGIGKTGIALKFTRDQASAVSIRQVERGAIYIGDERITDSIVLTHDKLIRDWFPADMEAMTEQDLGQILSLEPEIVILGTGTTPRRPPTEFLYALARRGVGLETMDTGAACRTFNILLAEGRRIVALLLLD